MKRADFARKSRDVVRNAERYHGAFYDANKFSGPSLYFHRRALAARKRPDFERQLEYVYAALASWGMHRMGPRGAKMVEFDRFEQSLLDLKPQVFDASTLTLDRIREGDWVLIQEIFTRMEVMSSGPITVGNSKVLAHLLPDLVPPIDREYTLHFLRGSKYVPVGPEKQWQLMHDVLVGFFSPIAKSVRFRSIVRRNGWLTDNVAYPWDTSVPKLIDNLVIGAKPSPPTS